MLPAQDDVAPHAALLRKATYASVGVALFLIAIKASAWLMTNSIGLQASLVDSVLDCAASLINLVAVREALKPADREHRFGHGKIEAVAALAQSMFIGGSAAWLIFESADRLAHPHSLEHTGAGILVMMISMVMTLGLVLFQNHVIKKTQSTAIRADAMHYRSDFLINGSVIVSLTAASWFHFPLLDPLVGAGIALYILYTAWTISKEAFDVLIDRELSDEDRERITQISLSHEDVTGLHDLRTRSSGPHKFIQLHLEMDGNMSLSAAHVIADDVALLIAEAFPSAEVIIHQDPYQLVGKKPSKKRTSS
ncbi:MAG: cation diffusion facilitator family transporter [Alphaproteobacteria bacterium]|nr:cation diffusion facilitator family transporter [Alphaproteobacteria bacterium]